MDKLEIKVYRHKIYKDIYLARNWHICGGCKDTEFFYATTDIYEALRNLSKGDILEEMQHWFYKDGHSELMAKLVLEKEMEFDGYKGKLRKELNLPVDDFEPITLKEA